MIEWVRVLAWPVAAVLAAAELRRGMAALALMLDRKRTRD